MTRKQLRRIVERANSHIGNLQGLSPEKAMAYFTPRVNGADVVYVIYQDPDSPNSVGRILIKGRHALARARSVRSLRIEALPARTRFEAEAINDAFGDGSTVIENYAPVPPEVAPHLDRLRAENEKKMQELDREIEQANANGDAIAAGTLTYADVFAAEVVSLIWTDRTCPHGIGRLLAKGRGRLMLALQAGKAPVLCTTSVRCRDAEHAAALWKTLGDGRGVTAVDAETAEQALDLALRGPRS